MSRISRIISSWIQQNDAVMRHHITTKVNSKIDPNTLDLEEWFIEGEGHPDEWSFDSYLEEIQHVLNDASSDMGVPLPLEVMAYRVSVWMGQNIPVTVTLVRNYKKFLKIFYEWEAGSATPEEERALLLAIKEIITPEIAQGMFPDGIDGIIQDTYQPRNQIGSPTESMKIVQLETGAYIFAVFEDKAAFMNVHTGETRIYTLDGTPVTGDNMQAQGHLIRGLRMSPEMIGPNQLAGYLGNQLAELIVGQDGISILDLPNAD